MEADVRGSSKVLRYAWIDGVVVLLVIAPRILRIAAENVQIEDPNYIYGGFLMLLGFRPFLDFAQPNPPLLESLLAVAYRLFGVSHRVPEMMTALACIVSAFLIRDIGRRWFSRFTGNVAAVAYAWHYLLFRYHLFEREIYATLAELAALNLLLGKARGHRRVFAGGVLMGVGFLCKQTAVLPFLVVFAFLLLQRRKPLEALAWGAGFSLVFAVSTGGYIFQYGEAYMRQIFWFHFIKGAVAPPHIKAAWTAAGLGFLAPPAVAAVFRLRERREAIMLLWALVWVDLLFFWLGSGAFWPHYLLSTLPPVCLLAAAGMETFVPRATSLSSRTRIAAASAAIIACGGLSFLNPGVFVGKGAAEDYGFSGTPRREVTQCAAFIRAHCPPDKMIISDPFIALESRRVKVIRFKDNWGLILWMNKLIDQGIYRREVKKMSGASFGEIRVRSQQYWMPELAAALESGKVGAIQPNYELPLNPEVMRKLGFAPGLKTRRYEIWVK